MRKRDRGRFMPEEWVWVCKCGELGDTRGGYGSCSRCGRKSLEQIEKERVK